MKSTVDNRYIEEIYTKQQTDDMWVSFTNEWVEIFSNTIHCKIFVLNYRIKELFYYTINNSYIWFMVLKLLHYIKK